MKRVAVLAVALGACGPKITLTDDIDLTWDFGLTISHFEDSLHTPYVKGAPVTLFVDSSDDNQRFDGWAVESSDPSVFAIGSTSISGQSFVANGVAVGAGVADLTIKDEHGEVVGVGTAEVAAPDRIELDAHGYLILGLDDQAPVDELRIVEGGTATYLVRYFNGGTELHGNQVLSAQAATNLTAEPRTTFLFENREWLTLNAGAAGAASVQLLADGDPLPSPPVIIVPETDIHDVELLTQSENGRKNGDWLVALAQARDVSARRIFGVDFQWDVDGLTQTADGDLYRYEFKGGDYEMVTARRNGVSDSAMIQSDSGFVDSSNRIGCSTGGSGPLAAIAALGLVRRRRSRRR
jgi:hypothetical protein